MSMTAMSLPVSPVAASDADVSGGHSAASPPVTTYFAAVSDKVVIRRAQT
jgi:hypothetical protein